VNVKIVQIIDTLDKLITDQVNRSLIKDNRILWFNFRT